MASFVGVIKTLSAQNVQRLVNVPRGRLPRERIELPVPVEIPNDIADDSEDEEAAAVELPTDSASEPDEEPGGLNDANYWVESLQPRGLCEEVATTVKYQARSAKEDEKELFKLILTKALEQDRDFQRRKRSRSKDQGERKRNNTNMHGGDSVQHRSKYRKVERNSGRQAGKGGATKQNPGKRATSSAPTGDCLKCKSDHWLVHSPTASADEKKELFQKMHERRDRQPLQARQDEHRLSMPYCADTRAEKSIISVRKLEELEKLGGLGKTTTLSRSIVCETVGKHEVLAQRSVLLQIMLHTAAGPMRPVKPYEVRISIEWQLEQLAERTSADDDDPIAFGEDFQTGCTPDEEIRQAVEAMIAKALEMVFRSKRRTNYALSSTCCQAFQVKPRAYPPHVRRFLQEFNDELVRLGWVYENSSSRWACPALPVMNPGKDEFRQTSDYRPANAEAEPIAGVMPILEVITEHVRDMCFFGLFDFIKGFWQLPLAKASQEILSYMTDAKVYTPTRVPQGCSDAALHFQVTMER
ncbi:hypothetical protein ON010_g15738 [Phytophthora cinnamomi]|nr:hypothetical protein ON010_g15738 [Phytophthora cinnamomi]